MKIYAGRIAWILLVLGMVLFAVMKVSAAELRNRGLNRLVQALDKLLSGIAGYP